MAFDGVMVMVIKPIAKELPELVQHISLGQRRFFA